MLYALPITRLATECEAAFLYAVRTPAMLRVYLSLRATTLVPRAGLEHLAQAAMHAMVSVLLHCCCVEMRRDESRQDQKSSQHAMCDVQQAADETPLYRAERPLTRFPETSAIQLSCLLIGSSATW